MKVELGQRVKMNGVECEVVAVVRDSRGDALVLRRPDGAKHHNVPADQVVAVAAKGAKGAKGARKGG